MALRGRAAAAVVALAVLVAGTVLAALDSARHRAAVEAEVARQVQTRADRLAAELTQLGRESRTLAGASRDDGFADATADVVTRSPAVLGALVVVDGALADIVVPALTPALLEQLEIAPGMQLIGDDVDPGLAAALRAVLDEGQLRLAGTFRIPLLGEQLGVLVDRAPIEAGRADTRLLLLLVDLQAVLATAEVGGSAASALDVTIRVHGVGFEGDTLGPTVLQGSEELLEDGVRADVDVAGVSMLLAGRPVEGWPRTSPAAPLILLPTLLGAGLAFQVVTRRGTEAARLRDRVDAATADLRRARAREAAAIEHSPVGLLDVADGVVTAVNAVGAELLDRPADDVVGQPLTSVLGHHVPRDHERELEVAVGDRVLVVRSSPVPDDDVGDEDRRIVGLADVTADRTSAQLLLAYTERLEEVNGQFDEIERVRSDLVAKVSHELRTPMTVVAGVGELLRNRDLPAERREVLLDALDRQVARLAEQVDGLLQLAELSRGPREAGGETDLAVTTRRVIADLGITCPVTGTGVARVASDSATRIVRALLTNAVKYGGAPIDVVLHREDGTVHLDVRDGGPGPGAVGDDPFGMFVQGTIGDRRTSQGLGVGLPVARGLARAEGGDLRLVQDGHPTVFRVSLPAVTRPTAPTASGTATAGDGVTQTVQLGRHGA